MSEGEDAAPALPNERSVPPAVAQAGCIVACGLALLPTFYVGSFAILLIDELYGSGWTRTVDDRTARVLEIVYWPLIWLVRQAIGF